MIVQGKNLVKLESTFDEFDLKRVKQNLHIVENPMMFSIMLKSGTFLFSHKFTNEFFFNDQILGGFLTAFNAFSNELFAESLDLAMIGPYRIVLVPIQAFVLCYVVKGNVHQARTKLNLFKKKLASDNILWTVIANAARTSEIIQESKYPPLMNLIEDIFLEKSSTDNFPINIIN